jgi:uncharacterized protein (TIGR04141 family)
VLCANGTFVHVKKGWGTSALSLVFDQGSVSAELLRYDPDFVQGALARIKKAEDDRQARPTDLPFPGRFQPVVDCADPPSGTRLTVYGIIERWQDKSVVDAMPFFGKVNLREAKDRLRRAGFAVAIKRIAKVTG